MLLAWRNLSLRVRLTVLYVGLLVVLLTALGSFLYFDTQSFLISSTVQRLESQNQPGIERGFRGRPPPLSDSSGSATPSSQPGTAPTSPPLADFAPFLAQSQTNPETTAAVYGPDGQLVADGRTQPEQPVSAPANAALISRALQGQRNLYYTTSVSGQHTLVVLIPLRNQGPTAAVGGVLQLSTRLDQVDAVLRRQQILIVGGILAALALGTLGGLWLTGSGLSPLRRMIVTSDRIAAGDLSQRVNLPHRSDEIGQLAASFDEMVERLEETFEVQRQFIGDASHELRTPLTAIAGSLDVILMAPEGDPETTHRMLNGMRRELGRLTRLVNDLLTLNRLDARQPMRMQTVDLERLAREVTEQIRPVVGERQIQITTRGDTQVTGDPDRLKQVLLNLIDNAVHFTDPITGVIQVSVEQADGVVRVSVTDNGPGVSPEALPHLFERFYRVDKARARTSGGSGLGLSIVKAIVEAHGGTLAPVSSQPGRGSTFALSIPQTARGASANRPDSGLPAGRKE